MPPAEGQVRQARQHADDGRAPEAEHRREGAGEEEGRRPRGPGLGPCPVEQRGRTRDRHERHEVAELQRVRERPDQRGEEGPVLGLPGVGEHRGPLRREDRLISAQNSATETTQAAVRVEPGDVVAGPVDLGEREVQQDALDHQDAAGGGDRERNGRHHAAQNAAEGESGEQPDPGRPAQGAPRQETADDEHHGDVRGGDLVDVSGGRKGGRDLDRAREQDDDQAHHGELLGVQPRRTHEQKQPQHHGDAHEVRHRDEDAAHRRGCGGEQTRPGALRELLAASHGTLRRRTWTAARRATRRCRPTAARPVRHRTARRPGLRTQPRTRPAWPAR